MPNLIDRSHEAVARLGVRRPHPARICELESDFKSIVDAGAGAGRILLPARGRSAAPQRPMTVPSRPIGDLSAARARPSLGPGGALCRHARPAMPPIGADKPPRKGYTGLRYRPLALDGVYERRPKRPAAFSLPYPAPRFGRLIALRGKTTEDRNLLTLLDPVAQAAGYEIVRLRLMGGTSARRLQIMAEREDGSMVVEDCAILARALNPVLDAADPIAGEYSLEVSSPGVDRPLTRLKDFAAYEGFEARLEIDRMAEGRKRFRGELAGVEDGHVAINLEGEAETALLPFEWLVDAKLVITDALLQRGADERAARMDTSDVEDLDLDSDAPPAAPVKAKKVRDLKPKPKAKAKPKPVANPNRARGPGGSDPNEDQKD